MTVHKHSIMNGLYPPWISSVHFNNSSSRTLTALIFLLYLGWVRVLFVSLGNTPCGYVIVNGVVSEYKTRTCTGWFG